MIDDPGHLSTSQYEEQAEIHEDTETSASGGEFSGKTGDRAQRRGRQRERKPRALQEVKIVAALVKEVERE